MGWGVQGLDPHPPRTQGRTRKGPEDTQPLLGSWGCAPMPQDWLPCSPAVRLGALGADGPGEATSLEQLFSMVLASADKPYQLISPPTDRQKVPRKWHPGAPLAACPAS